MEATVYEMNQITIGLQNADKTLSFEAALKMKWYSQHGLFNFSGEIGFMFSQPLMNFSKEHTTETLWINVNGPTW